MKGYLSTAPEGRCPKMNVWHAGLNGGGAGLRACGDWQNCALGLAGNFNRGVEQFGEGFDASNEARAGPRKAAVRFQSVNAPISNSWNGMPGFREGHRLVFVAGLPGVVAARGNEQDFRRGVDDILDCDSKGRRPGGPKTSSPPAR